MNFHTEKDLNFLVGIIKAQLIDSGELEEKQANMICSSAQQMLVQRSQLRAEDLLKTFLKNNFPDIVLKESDLEEINKNSEIQSALFYWFLLDKKHSYTETQIYIGLYKYFPRTQDLIKPRASTTGSTKETKTSQLLDEEIKPVVEKKEQKPVVEKKEKKQPTVEKKEKKITTEKKESPKIKKKNDTGDKNSVTDTVKNDAVKKALNRTPKNLRKNPTKSKSFSELNTRVIKPRN